jgi:hypothetical protein
MTDEAGTGGHCPFAVSVQREWGRILQISGGKNPPVRDPTRSAVLAVFAAVLVHVLSGRGDLMLVTTPCEKTAYRGTQFFSALLLSRV